VRGEAFRRGRHDPDFHPLIAQGAGEAEQK
jgi:hypothetical protein